MRVAITLPQFRDDPGPALAAAAVADALDLDGVFVFDHLWAIGSPAKPAIPAFPLLGALAATTSRLSIGSLVARIGLVPDAVLVHQFLTLKAMVGDRLIAGIGTGDRLSVQENVAYGIDYPPAAERRSRVGKVADELRAHGITTWVGGRAERTRLVAIDHADALNLWDVDAGILAAERRVQVTWGGQVPPDEDAAASLLAGLSGAGATWAVCAPAYGADPDPTAAVEALAASVTASKRRGAGGERG